MVHALVVREHGSATTEQLSRDLRRQGFETTSIGSGGEALRAHIASDLVLIYLDLPDTDGIAVCRRIRAVSDVPVIIFTERDDELDRVLALQAGADDCVVSSCGNREVLARVDAVMRRCHRGSRDSSSLSVGTLSINGRTREVQVDGRPISLTTKEFDVLHTLVMRDTVVSRRDLMVAVWGAGDPGRSRTLDTHVSSLRGKIGADMIVTVWGIGYRIGRQVDDGRTFGRSVAAGA